MKAILKGLLTFLPGLRAIARRKKPDGTVSAAYCYGVWIKHLTLLHEHGMRSVPSTVAELGPGDSIGTGLAAVLSGTQQYFALDVVEHSDYRRNLEVIDELSSMFANRVSRPTKGWPDFDEYLDSNLFPSHIITDDVLRRSLAEERVDRVRDALSSSNRRPTREDIRIEYMVPWNEFSVIEPESVDLIISHSVLEHVEDLNSTYKAFNAWLKPGGWMSHQIDFSSHGLTSEWNGHRKFSELAWKAIKGSRPYLINRAPCSEHIDLLNQTGFDLKCCLKDHREDGLRRAHLAKRWRNISEDDLSCASLFVQATKR